MSENRTIHILSIIFFTLILGLIYLFNYNNPINTDYLDRIELDGLWKYEYGENTKYIDKDFDDSNWEEGEFDHYRVENEPEKQNTWVYFRKNISIPSEYKSQDLMIYLGKMANHRVYMNGYLIGKSIETEHMYLDWNKRSGYLIPSSIIEYDEDNLIVLSVHSTYEYGGSDDIYIDDYNTTQAFINSKNFYSQGVNIALFFYFFINAFYFIILSLIKPIEHKKLYFGLLYFFMSIYISNFFVSDLPITYLSYQKIVYGSATLCTLFFLLFIKQHFQYKLLLFDRIFIVVMSMVFVYYSLTTYTLVDFFIFRINYIKIYFLLLSYVVVICIKALVDKNRKVGHLLWGFIIIAITFIFDITFEFLRYKPPLGDYLNGYAIIIFLVTMSFQMSMEYKRLYIEARKDGLTGLYNYSYFSNLLFDICYRKSRKYTYSLAFIDVDNFKRINDEKGHLIGDETLKVIAGSILSASDEKKVISARYGGDEFVMLIKGEERKEIDYIIAKLKDGLQRWIDEKNVLDNLTLSIGIATLKTTDETLHPELFIKMADQAAYYSKENGKDSITYFEDIQ